MILKENDECNCTRISSVPVWRVTYPNKHAPIAKIFMSDTRIFIILNVCIIIKSPGDKINQNLSTCVRSMFTRIRLNLPDVLKSYYIFLSITNPKLGIYHDCVMVVRTNRPLVVLSQCLRVVLSQCPVKRCKCE